MKKKAAKIFDLMANFAKYGFNKSHSAAYALVAYQTAYLKAHYRVEFFAGLLTSEMNNQDKIVSLISECRDSGLIVQPPDINQSDTNFSVDGETDSLWPGRYQRRRPVGHRIHSIGPGRTPLYRSVRLLRAGRSAQGQPPGSGSPDQVGGF